MRCRAPGSRGARGVGEARGGRGDCDSGPGTRVSAVTCRAPPPAGLTPPRRAASGSGWEPSRGARPILPFVAAASWAAGASGMQKVPLAPRHPSSTFSSSPPPPQPPAAAQPLWRRNPQGRRAEWERDAPLALSGLRKVLPPRPREGRLGGSRSRPRRPRTFSFAASELVGRAF